MRYASTIVTFETLCSALTSPERRNSSFGHAAVISQMSLSPDDMVTSGPSLMKYV